MSLSPESQHINENSQQATCEPGSKASENKVVHLLVPIGRAPDVIYGARYAKNLLADGRCIKVSLLHVTKPRREEASLHSSGIDLIEEEHAEALLREAALHLNEYHVSHRTYIISGDVVFSILDAAELLNCDEIILPATKHRFWLRPFSSDIVGKIVRSARSVPVVTVESNGLRSSSNKSHGVHCKSTGCTIKSA